jgi:hypothetical protein
LKGLASFCEQMTAQLKHIISVATAQHDFWSPNLRRSLLRFDRLEDENCIEVLYGAFEPTYGPAHDWQSINPIVQPARAMTQDVPGTRHDVAPSRATNLN